MKRLKLIAAGLLLSSVSDAIVVPLFNDEQAFSADPRGNYTLAVLATDQAHPWASDGDDDVVYTDYDSFSFFGEIGFGVGTLLSHIEFTTTNPTLGAEIGSSTGFRSEGIALSWIDDDGSPSNGFATGDNYIGFRANTVADGSGDWYYGYIAMTITSNAYSDQAGLLLTDINYFYEDQLNGAITVAAVPEPSTYAAVLGLLGLGFAFVRRRHTRSIY